MRRLVERATELLTAAGDPDRAPAMAAYMKTDQPFHGVAAPARRPIVRELAGDFEPATRDEHDRLVLGLWGCPHREDRYVAIDLARRWRRFHTPASLPLYRRLVVEGAWWDLVDPVATGLVGPTLRAHPEAWAEVDAWIDADDLWLRRAAIICQVGARGDADADRLFAFCAARAHEREFFIRKAIGWALRDHARTDPDGVTAFVDTHRDSLSPLSIREATKHLRGPTT